MQPEAFCFAAAPRVPAFAFHFYFYYCSTLLSALFLAPLALCMLAAAIKRLQRNGTMKLYLPLGQDYMVLAYISQFIWMSYKCVRSTHLVHGDAWSKPSSSPQFKCYFAYWCWQPHCHNITTNKLNFAFAFVGRLYLPTPPSSQRTHASSEYTSTWNYTAFNCGMIGFCIWNIVKWRFRREISSATSSDAYRDSGE